MKTLKSNLGFIGLAAFAISLLGAIIFEYQVFGLIAAILFLILTGYCMLFYNKPRRYTS